MVVPSGRGETTSFAPPRALANATCAALAAARDALRGVPFSRGALRSAVVRYAAAARDAGASVAELTEALDFGLAPALGRLPAAVAADLRVHVAWWAAHGYHRAD
ncbi:hypothetical protein tb265_33640 [Gemmatimonadetes bacterium T265]|nr:hypothetical protein tb265_33640 [Gemmatimonadetes bacterium T265]